MRFSLKKIGAAIVTVAASVFFSALAQTVPNANAPNPNATGAPQAVVGPDSGTCGGAYRGVELLPDNRVIFRICAPQARAAMVADDAGVYPPLSKDATGMFSGTSDAPLPARVYRYFFIVDGVRIVDPHATRFSENRDGVMGVFEVKGPEGDFLAFKKDIPHGSVSTVEYWSKSLDAERRLHVYLPPGYEKNTTRYPVLYLLHGAGDNDTSWSTVGRANLILDNLIAAGRAKPMIVIMPAGHTPPRGPAAPLPPPSAMPQSSTSSVTDDFGQDLLNDVLPLVKARYRIIENADDTAIAGLSMGGAQALRSGLLHPELFHYVGLLSSGVRDAAAFDRQNGATLDIAGRKTKLVYYALGKEDPFTRDPAILTDLFAAHHIKFILNYTEGGHNWMNWQDYFYDFAPRLFR